MGGHSSGLFSGTIGQITIRNVSGFGIDTRTGTTGSSTLHNPVLEATRVGSALKDDAYHAFPDIVDNWAGYARGFSITGGDGKSRMLYQLAGSLNGAPGVFEWIVDPVSSSVTHRLFIPGGKVTGRPNQRPRRGRKDD